MPVSDALEACSLALAEALEQSGLDPGRRCIGLAMGTALGGLACGPYAPPSLLADRLARRFRLTGPVTTFSVTCTSSVYALQQARLDLEAGRADAMICAGVDTLSNFMAAGFQALNASLPLGEAACAVALEGSARGSLGRVLGCGLRAEGMHLTSPDPSGRGMIAAIRRAAPRLDRLAGVSVTASASPVYQVLYRNTFDQLFGGEPPGVASWEGRIGHVLAASGMVGVVHAVRRLPDLMGDVLALTVGFGGQNGAMRIGLR